MHTGHFEWDEAKARRNLRKHGISFPEATTVFADPWSLTLPNPDLSLDEERLVTIGFSERLRLLVVVHCERRRGRTLRLISARRATRSEAVAYAAHHRR